MKIAATFEVAALTALIACAVSATASDRPETAAFPFRESIAAGGTYAAGSTVGTNFVVSGSISKALTFSGDVPYRVTLSDATVSKAITLSGDAQLWLEGDNSVEISDKIAITSTGSLTIGGPGSLALASVPPKKQTGPIVAEDLVIAGGDISITLNADVKNIAGITLAGNFEQLAGTVSIDCSSYGATNKVNGILVNKKNKSVTVSGGTLAVSVCGDKSVGISLDKDGTTMTLSGGAVELTVAGDGAKGIKGDGSFTMTDGILNASVTGGVLYEDVESGDGTNYVVSVTSTSLLSSTGTYIVQDTSPAYAVKCGSIAISGGTVRVDASGVSSRGLCADADGGTFDISGGYFDITCSGAASDTVLELLDETALTTEIDKSTACALRTSESNSTFTITGGTLNLVATGTGGKCLVAKGEMVVGTSGQMTTPSDSAFYPDLQSATYGEQVYVAAKKQKNYLSVGTAYETTDISSAKYAKNYIVSGSGENVDYSNPKCIKAEGNLTMHGGRIRGFSQAEGGEGFESKKVLTINGGVFEATTYDDCINASESVVINGGYLYCGATNNDCIDSNGSGSDSVVINGGIVLCFTAATPECGIDTDYSGGIQMNGGTIVSFGSATDMAYGSCGSLKTYRSTSVSASTYAGKYLKITGGSKTVYVKVPSMSSTSGSLSLVCTTIGANAFAGCTALATFTGAGVATVGADAFNGCTSLSAVPASATTLGAYAYAQSGVTGVDVSGVSSLGEGAFAGCTNLTAATVGSALPAALFSGCTALNVTDWSDVTTFGQASLAGIPSTTLTLSSAASLADYAIAADEATVVTTLTEDAVPTYGDTSFLGREVSFTVGEGVVARIEAEALVNWLASEASDADSTVEQPSSYATADLETWLATPANASSILAFCYAGQLAADEDFHPLDVDGTSFVWAAQDSGTEDAVTLTLEGSYALGDDEDWSSDILVWDDDAEAYVAEDADAEACFARLKIEKGW